MYQNLECIDSLAFYLKGITHIIRIPDKLFVLWRIYWRVLRTSEKLSFLQCKENISLESHN